MLSFFWKVLAGNLIEEKRLAGKKKYNWHYPPLRNINIAMALHAVTSCVIVEELFLKNSDICMKGARSEPGQMNGEFHYPGGWRLRIPARSVGGRFK